ncbi:hypothetical protein ACE2AK_23095 [Rahnella perminowiae]|uniref:hypothetical protein n=1 Tax=Rahnella perminowiae TaxID=2816244 RepID=UPI00365A3864
MSVIQSLIKQAFGTGNGNEAATFLASACNRMKAMDKMTIAREVESALRGVSFSRAESEKTKVKTVYKDTAVTLEKLLSLEKQVRSLTHELAVARNQTHGGNTEDVEQMKGELSRLNTRISELLRQSDIQKKQHADELTLLRSRQRATGNSTSAELDAANRLIAYTGSQMAAMAAARDTLQQRLSRLETESERQMREEEDKRHAANRRADGNYALLGQQKELTAEANRKITQLRASLKLEEYEGQSAKNEKAKLKKKIAELEEENSCLAERLRDNEEDCERLSDALDRTNQEFAAYKAQKERLNRWIHVPGAMMGISVVALVLYSDAQPGHLFDSLAPAAFLGCVVYALSLMIAFTRRA